MKDRWEKRVNTEKKRFKPLKSFKKKLRHDCRSPAEGRSYVRISFKKKHMYTCMHWCFSVCSHTINTISDIGPSVDVVDAIICGSYNFKKQNPKKQLRSRVVFSGFVLMLSVCCATAVSVD